MNMTPRPRLSDEPIVRAACAILAPKVKAWCEEDRGLSVDQITDDLVSVVRHRNDGYDIATSLDGLYNPDAALVEILDEAEWLKLEALSKAEAEWVTANNIPEIPIDTKVRYPREAGVGVVTANHPDGKSTVTYEHLGHKPGCGYVVPWEQLLVEQPTE